MYEAKVKYCTFEALTPSSLNSISLLPFVNCRYSKKKHKFVAPSAVTYTFWYSNIFVVIFQAFYPMDRTYDIKKGDVLVSETKNWFYLNFYLTSINLFFNNFSLAYPFCSAFFFISGCSLYLWFKRSWFTWCCSHGVSVWLTYRWKFKCLQTVKEIVKHPSDMSKPYSHNYL